MVLLTASMVMMLRDWLVYCNLYPLISFSSMAPEIQLFSKYISDLPLCEWAGGIFCAKLHISNLRLFVFTAVANRLCIAWSCQFRNCHIFKLLISMLVSIVLYDSDLPPTLATTCESCAISMSTKCNLTIHIKSIGSQLLFA